MPGISIINSNELQEMGRWDAEAFSPELRQLEYALKDFESLGDPNICTVIHPAEIPREYTIQSQGVPFILAGNIKSLMPDLTTLVFIPKDVAKELSSNRLTSGDILVTRTGASHGIACIYLGETASHYTSGEGLIVRVQGDIDPAYLIAFLSSRFGEMLCKKAVYGSGQPHIGPSYLRKIPILRLGPIEAKIASIVRLAWKTLESSQPAYHQVETEVLERLGLNKITNQQPELSFVRDFSAFNTFSRLDAEHFQPMYLRLRKHLLNHKALPLSALSEKVRRGIQPEYVTDGPILVVNSRHLGPTGIDVSRLERTSNAFHFTPEAESARLRQFDVLLYSTGAYIGRTNVWLENNAAIASNHVSIIRVKDKRCNPIYLAVYLNSIAGIMQSEQYSSGSAQREIYPSEIEKFLICLPMKNNDSVDIAWQTRIANMVIDASRAKQKAQALIDEAKRHVEAAIEMLTSKSRRP